MQNYVHLLRVGFTGFWLGLLSRDDSDRIDEEYYSNVSMYQSADYNKSGLWNWEKEVIHKYYPSAASVLVGATGGGREVYALRQLGYEADGFESHPAFASFANDLLQEAYPTATVFKAERDSCPHTEKTYDGLIVGWGGYMSIPTRRRRTDFLRSLRILGRGNAPLLVSFFVRSEKDHKYRRAAGLANLIRRIRGVEQIEVGDWLAENYVHYFTEDEIRSELDEAGFDMVYFKAKPYGHAVGIARSETQERDAHAPPK